MKEVINLTTSRMDQNGYLVYAKGNIIATVSLVSENDNDCHYAGQFRICFTRGKLQGKKAYADCLDEVNDRICAVIDSAI